MKTNIQENQVRTRVELPVVQLNTNEYDLAASPRSLLLAPFRDSNFGLGLLLLALSGIAFLLYDFLSDPRRESSSNVTLITFHYSIALLYSGILLTNGYFRFAKRKSPEDRSARWLGLLLWLISAYALNREIAVFQRSTEWLCWVLVMVSAAMLLYSWKESLSVRVQQLLHAVLAIGWWLFFYMSVYVVELYPISIPLLIALGLSIHAFVPLAFAIALGKRLWQDVQREEHLRLGVTIGLLLPVVVTGLFLAGWSHTLSNIEQTRQQATIRKASDLPDWVLIAQNLKPGWITNRLLLSNRIYDQGSFFDGTSWALGNLTSLDEVRQHDPLVVIASRLFPTGVLSDADQFALLKVFSGNRHGTEEKFWTGRHLTTQDIVSQVRIWPQFRISYTEQTLRIRNQARNTTEEALMTFHMPPGSVVSAMSLWVNDREEPARLTTVAKADSAYRTVVGVESRVLARDPSVVYWQEGNRVTVRVFPCRAGEDRRVKLGITSPLQLTGNQLSYQTPYIEGPTMESTREFVHVDFASPPTDLKTPWLIDGLQGNTITHRGSYDPDWTLRFHAPHLSSDAFVLNGHAYQVELQKPVNEAFTPTDVYLDVTKSWLKSEFVTAFQTAIKQPNGRVWVFDDGLKQLTEKDLDTTYERLSRQQFSLFPIYRIASPATALLITKGTPMSPILTDLQGSPFADRLGILTKQTAPLRTFCYDSAPGIGELPAYLKTLAELRVLNVTHGSADDLVQYISQKQFRHPSDEPNRIALSEAGIAIRETPATVAQASVAPDHLARLFTYNQLLQQIGRQYFVKNYQTDELIQKAQQAHVVSPLSSLVVLETAADYERFGIKKDASGLDNATLKEEGAVPEPHEWALLVMLAGLIGWLYWKKHYAIP